jgi:hypothetical protein
MSPERDAGLRGRAGRFWDERAGSQRARRARAPKPASSSGSVLRSPASFPVGQSAKCTMASNRRGFLGAKSRTNSDVHIALICTRRVGILPATPTNDVCTASCDYKEKPTNAQSVLVGFLRSQSSASLFRHDPVGMTHFLRLRRESAAHLACIRDLSNRVFLLQTREDGIEGDLLVHVTTPL